MGNLANFAENTFAAAVDNVTTSWTLTDAAAFPAPTNGDYWVLAWDKGTFANPKDDANSERVRVINKTGNVLTVVRGENGQTAVAHSAGHTVAILGDAENLRNVTHTNPVAYGAHPDNTDAVNRAAIQNAIDALERVGGGVLEFEHIKTGVYGIDDQLTMTAPIWVKGNGCTIEQKTTGANKSAFKITSSGCHFRDLIVKGPSSGSLESTASGLYFEGTLGGYLSAITVYNCQFERFQGAGVYATFCRDIAVDNNLIKNFNYAGIAFFHCTDYSACGNKIRDIVGASGTVYGIIATRTDTNDIAVFPRCLNGTICNNTIDNVTNWEGIDTHSGQGLTIANNTIRRCHIGISISDSRNLAATFVYAPLDVQVVGNYIDSGKTDGTAGNGIIFHGSSPGVASFEQLARGSIIGNTVRGHGDENEGASSAGGIYMYATQSVTVIGNSLYENSSNGISLDFHNYGFSVSGNSIVDTWSTANTAIAIFLKNYPNKGYIGGNTFSKESKVATSVMAQGTNINTNAATKVELGSNANPDGTVGTMLADASTNGTLNFEGQVNIPATHSLNGAKVLVATPTWDPNSILNGNTTAGNFTVTGAALGNPAFASFPIDDQNVTVTAQVTAANTVTVSITNNSGGTKDYPLSTVKIMVWQ